MDIEKILDIMENGSDEEVERLADLAYEGFKMIAPLLPEVDPNA